MSKSLIAFFAAFLSAQYIHAQMGSPGHGETQAVALHPTNPDIIYAGAAKGLCKTLNGGKDNWPTYDWPPILQERLS